jgi:hypothetical protein
MDEPERSPSQRRFSDKEIQAILARAAELQRRRGAREAGGSQDSDSASGVSLAELQSVAREAGIDPALIREAAVELDHRPPSGRFSIFLGENRTQQARRHLDAKLSEEDLEELLVTLDTVAGEAGHGTVSRSTLSWSTDTAIAMRNGYQTRVQVRSNRRGTDISARTELGNLAGGLFGGLTGGFGVGGGLGVGLGVGLDTLNSVPFAVLVPIGFIGAAYLLARTIYGAIARHRRRRNTQIVEELAAAAQDLTDHPPGSGPNAPTPPR